MIASPILSNGLLKTLKLLLDVLKNSSATNDQILNTCASQNAECIDCFLTNGKM